MRKIISFVAIAQTWIAASAQFKIETCADFEKLTKQDSAFILDASYDLEVKRCFVFKFNQDDMVITYGLDGSDLVVMASRYEVMQVCEFKKEEFIVYENDKK